MTLKTLKDLRCVRNEEFSCCDGDKSKCDEPWTKDEELKAEAVKWVKGMEMVNKHMTAREFIQAFLNLTSEDLK